MVTSTAPVATTTADLRPPPVQRALSPRLGVYGTADAELGRTTGEWSALESSRALGPGQRGRLLKSRFNGLPIRVTDGSTESTAMQFGDSANEQEPRITCGFVGKGQGRTFSTT